MLNSKSVQDTQLYPGEYLIVTLTLWLCIEWYFHDTLRLRQLLPLHVDAAAIQSETLPDSQRLQPVTLPSHSTPPPSETCSSPNTSDLQIPRGFRQGWGEGKWEKQAYSGVCRVRETRTCVCVCVDGIWMSVTRGVRNEFVLHNDYKCPHSLRLHLCRRSAGIVWSAVYLSVFTSRHLSAQTFLQWDR